MKKTMFAALLVCVFGGYDVLDAPYSFGIFVMVTLLRLECNAALSGLLSLRGRSEYSNLMLIAGRSNLF